ncbi:MAG: ABC transporter permease [Aestuariivirgaceae bacterium]
MPTKSWLGTFYTRNGLILGSCIILAVLAWIFLMIVLPQIAMLDFSFSYDLPRSMQGGPEDVYTLANYRYFLFGYAGNRDGYNYLDLMVFGRTLVAAVFVTIIDLILCYPIAFYLAQVARGRMARILAVALIVPYWINEILRAFAFRIIFGATGIINGSLIGLGIIDSPIDFVRENVALYAGLAYAYVLLMVFPIYNAIESLDRNQIEAARDMGAPWWRIHWRVVIPFAKPGITSGCTIVFMLAAGALAAPQILGGPSSLWFTQIIYRTFFESVNWSRGAAYAVILLVVCTLFVLLMMRIFKVKLGEIGR